MTYNITFQPPEAAPKWTHAMSNNLVLTRLLEKKLPEERF